MLEVNNISKVYKAKGKSAKVHALSPLSFFLKKGESIAVFGKNGTGKTTLLKILANIIKPTSGDVNFEGKALSIIEFGSGFHPDLTGRENIYFLGNLYGYNKRFISTIISTIIDFSGLEDKIEQPIKHYSNGMFLRLAFSCISHFPCDMLILDEVIQVGDISFKKKSFDRITYLKKNGVSIIFTSHDIESYAMLFEKGLWLNDSNYLFGDFDIVYFKYLEGLNEGKRTFEIDENCKIEKVSVNGNQKIDSLINVFSNQKIEIKIIVILNQLKSILQSSIDISCGSLPLVFSTHKYDFRIGQNEIIVEIPEHFFAKGIYTVTFWIGNENETTLLKEGILNLNIVFNEEVVALPWNVGKRIQPIRPKLNWM